MLGDLVQAPPPADSWASGKVHPLSGSHLLLCRMKEIELEGPWLTLWEN